MFFSVFFLRLLIQIRPAGSLMQTAHCNGSIQAMRTNNLSAKHSSETAPALAQETKSKNANCFQVEDTNVSKWLFFGFRDVPSQTRNFRCTQKWTGTMVVVLYTWFCFCLGTANFVLICDQHHLAKPKQVNNWTVPPTEIHYNSITSGATQFILAFFGLSAESNSSNRQRKQG